MLASKSWRTGWFCSFKKSEISSLKQIHQTSGLRMASPSPPIRSPIEGAAVSGSDPGRFVSVKLTPVGRAQTVLFDDPSAAPVPHTGQQVVVQTDGGPAVGRVVRSIPQLAERRRLPADSPHRVVRL